jgi:PTH2 family peptidyl-tRNA hydrolase
MHHTPQIRDSTAMGTAIAFLVVGSIAGFFLGRVTTRAASTGTSGSSAKHVKSIAGFNGEDEDEDDQELQSFENQLEEMKLILVVRTDLGMTKGGA